MWDDFKKFAFKGNVIDMAVGVVIGGAFGTIVKSIVDNLIMPPIGVLTGGLDFGARYVVLKAPPVPGAFADADSIAKAGGVVLRYGAVINAVLSFFIVAIAVFALVKSIAVVWKKEDPAATTRDCPECKMPVPTAAKKCGHCTSVIAT